MPIKKLKGFQEAAVASAVKVFTYAQSLLDTAGTDDEQRAVAIHDNGYLLIEAPTGAGKTLMAGCIIEKMAAVDDVVWFWFAPFKGVVEQTAAFLKEQFAGLRLRTLTEDRTPAGSRKGDVFVTTWQLVATRAKDSRNVRKTGERNPSIDDLVAALREQGMRIGVVVDEAHHGFHGDTQAAQFFRGVLKPEYTILVTATPDDEDLADLQKRMQFGRVQRISISRADAVGPGPGQGLIKEGIKCIAWTADEDKKRLIDFEMTALREGTLLHRELKALLAKEKIPLVPLMLVQVASSEKSVDRAKEKLLQLGFTDAQIAVHTADEPDAGLMALANDETREVLIFKMAVALGFDAPRAWTLVSMRAARDPDFGVQLVGRILRVHRRLQGRKVPEPLRFGYVLLADHEAQAGLDAAGQRINKLKTEYAKLSPTTVVVKLGDEEQVQYIGPSGQITFLPVPPPGAIWRDRPARTSGPEQLLLPDLVSSRGPRSVEDLPAGGLPLLFGAPSPALGAHRYLLREDVPRQFKTQELPDDFDVTEEDCAKRFVVSADAMLDAVFMRDRVKVQKRTLEIFTQKVQQELAFTPPSREQMRLMAQRELLRSDVFHPKDLRAALMTRLREVLLERGAEDATDRGAIADYLDLLLATHPELLREAQRRSLAESATIQDAEELPTELEADEPLVTSVHNVYRVLPPKMNSWEVAFGQLLDSDVSGTVLWWHRNLPHKPWSIKVLLDDGRGFFPDFIVGIHRRKKDNNGLLADTKYAYDTNKELPKILAEHASYGRVLILSQENKQWKIAELEAGTGRPRLGSLFRLADASHY